MVMIMLHERAMSDFYRPEFRRGLIQTVAQPGTYLQYSSVSPIHTGQCSFKESSQQTCTYSHIQPLRNNPHLRVVVK